ncbi:MAG TPA: hypothetical protein VMG12_43270 [Polyangiaceae bacterium]|nr:hypothetical protein [Polyangiaceae bacterium]
METSIEEKADEADVAWAVDGRLEPSLTWRIAETAGVRSPNGPPSLTLLALSYRPAEFGAPLGTLSPRLFLLQRRAHELDIVALRTLDLERAECRNDSGEPGADDERRPS